MLLDLGEKQPFGFTGLRHQRRLHNGAEVHRDAHRVGGRCAALPINLSAVDDPAWSYVGESSGPDLVAKFFCSDSSHGRAGFAYLVAGCTAAAHIHSARDIRLGGQRLRRHQCGPRHECSSEGNILHFLFPFCDRPLAWADAKCTVTRTRRCALRCTLSFAHSSSS